MTLHLSQTISHNYLETSPCTVFLIITVVHLDFIEAKRLKYGHKIAFHGIA